MERHFDEELNNLKQLLLKMADEAQEMVGLAVKSLVERNQDFAKEVFALENAVNRQEVEIEDEVLKLMALHQPAGSDLRFLTAVLKINNDLERVADQAVNIGEISLRLLKEPPLKPLIDIPHMAKLAQTMIKQSLDALVRHDAALAKRVCESDDAVDQLNEQVFRELLTYMIENPKNIARAVDLILVSRNLERVADHATNISEDVIFIEQGKNIKHHLGDPADPAPKP